jgi:hypothetical protein
MVPKLYNSSSVIPISYILPSEFVAASYLRDIWKFSNFEIKNDSILHAKTSTFQKSIQKIDLISERENCLLSISDFYHF